MHVMTRTLWGDHKRGRNREQRKKTACEVVFPHLFKITRKMHNKKWNNGMASGSRNQLCKTQTLEKRSPPHTHTHTQPDMGMHELQVFLFCMNWCFFSTLAEMWETVAALVLQPRLRRIPQGESDGINATLSYCIGEWVVQIMQCSLIKLKGSEAENASPILQICKSRIYPAVTDLRFKKIFW